MLRVWLFGGRWWGGDICCDGDCGDTATDLAPARTAEVLHVTRYLAGEIFNVDEGYYDDESVVSANAYDLISIYVGLPVFCVIHTLDKYLYMNSYRSYVFL